MRFLFLASEEKVAFQRKEKLRKISNSALFFLFGFVSKECSIFYYVACHVLTTHSLSAISKRLRVDREHLPVCSFSNTNPATLSKHFWWPFFFGFFLVACSLRPVTLPKRETEQKKVRSPPRSVRWSYPRVPPPTMGLYGQSETQNRNSAMPHVKIRVRRR